MKFKEFALFVFCLVTLSCNNQSTTNLEKESPKNFSNKGHELIYNMVKQVGDYSTLAAKKDVIYTYTYETPDGKSDVSTEKYIFDGELSYGKYNKHQRTFPDLDGPFEQGFDGKVYWLKHNNEIITDSVRLKRVAFNRPTNFYWFAMFQKLLDPGVKYEHLGEQEIDSNAYNVVKISFNQEGDKPTDIYQIYINKNSGLVDQFLFTVADFGVMENPLLMKLEYEEFEGILIPNKRKYKKSNWEAEINDKPWIKVNWTDIRFNNGLSEDDFKG